MAIPSWYHKFFHGKVEAIKTARRTRLGMEPLEGREVPAVITVTSLLDNLVADGQVTLREALRAAETDASVDGSAAGSGADTIVFAPALTAAGSVNLNLAGHGSTVSGRSAFAVTTPVTIQGPTGDRGIVLAATGGNRNPYRHFLVAGTGDLTLANLNLTGGYTHIYGDVASDTNGGGGSIYTAAGGRLTARNCTFANNVAMYGGAIANDGGIVALTNSTFYENQTNYIVPLPPPIGEAGEEPELPPPLPPHTRYGQGGAVFTSATGTSRVTNGTFTRNDGFGVGKGQAIQTETGGTLVLNNSILGNYRNDTFANPAQLPFIVRAYTGGNNLIDRYVTLGPLGWNGGPTVTTALLPGSPAIDAGSAAGAPAQDQRGVARVGAVDLGAFESRGFTVTVADGDNQGTPATTDFARPLAVRVSSA